MSELKHNFNLDDETLDLISSHDEKFRTFNNPTNLKSVDNTSTSNPFRMTKIGTNSKLINTHKQLHNTKWGKK